MVVFLLSSSFCLHSLFEILEFFCKEEFSLLYHLFTQSFISECTNRYVFNSLGYNRMLLSLILLLKLFQVWPIKALFILNHLSACLSSSLSVWVHADTVDSCNSTRFVPAFPPLLICYLPSSGNEKHHFRYLQFMYIFAQPQCTQKAESDVLTCILVGNNYEVEGHAFVGSFCLWHYRLQ